MLDVRRDPGPVSISQRRIPAVFRAETLPSNVLTSTKLQNRKTDC